MADPSSDEAQGGSALKEDSDDEPQVELFAPSAAEVDATPAPAQAQDADPANDAYDDEFDTDEPEPVQAAAAPSSSVAD